MLNTGAVFLRFVTEALLLYQKLLWKYEETRLLGFNALVPKFLLQISSDWQQFWILIDTRDLSIGLEKQRLLTQAIKEREWQHSKSEAQEIKLLKLTSIEKLQILQNIIKSQK